MMYDGDDDDEDQEENHGDDDDDVVDSKHSYERRMAADAIATASNSDGAEDEVGDDFDDFEEGAEADDFGDFDEETEPPPPPKQSVMPTPPSFVSRDVTQASIHCITHSNHQTT